MPKTPIKRYFGLNVIGKTKKSKKVIGLSGRFKQKKDKLAITKAELPINEDPVVENINQRMEPAKTLKK